MPFTTARDTRFHMMELASGRTGEPVVMLHGLFTGSLASWYLTAAPAIAARRRVRLFDWRGHGLSERTRTGYGASAMADDLDALTADLPPFTIVGHSYGCVVGLRFLQSRRGRVRRMALVEPPLAEVAEPVPAGAAPPGDRQRFTPARLRALRADPSSKRVRGLLENTTLLDDLAAEPPVTDEDLRSLAEVPCMVIGGARSPYAPSLERVRRACPRVRGHMLNGGHDIHVTDADDVTALLTGFLGAARSEEAAHG
jgi:pimeloyl-ACP methyl ester carboxylesterase